MIDYSEEWPLATIFRWRGSVIPRAVLYAVPSPLVAALIILCEDMYPDAMLQLRLNDVSVGHMYTASTAALMLLIAFRTSQAHSRYWEGTSLLHQMQGEWFDSVSCLFTFSRGALGEKQEDVTEFRHTLVRLMSLCHGSALEEIKEGPADEVEVLDINGLDQRTLVYLDQCKVCFDFNRVEVLLHMIQVLMTVAHEKGVLTVAPPILSRVYQTLSRGLVNLLNVMKIKHTSFPFPWAQLISVSILVLTIWTPFLITAVVKSYWLACFMAVVPVFGMVSLNMVAIELERPFGNDMNDLPLDHFQRHMNNGLLMLLHEKSDIVAHTSPQCKKSLHELMGEAINEMAPKDLQYRQDMLAAAFNVPFPDLSESLTPISVSLGNKKRHSSMVSDMTSSTSQRTPSMGALFSMEHGDSLQSILAEDSTLSSDNPPDDVAPEEDGAPSSPPPSRGNVALLQGADGSGGTVAGADTELAEPAQEACVEAESAAVGADREATGKAELACRRRAGTSLAPVSSGTAQIRQTSTHGRLQSKSSDGQGQDRGIKGLDWDGPDGRFDKLFQLWAQKADAHLEALRQNNAVIAERMVSLSRKRQVVRGGQEAPHNFGSEWLQDAPAYMGS